MGVWEPCTCQPDRPNCPACSGAEHPCLLCKPEPPRPRDGWWFISVGAGAASYAHRAELKALHLRWDPAAREWSGVVLGADIGALEGLGLAVEVRQRRQPREPVAPGQKRDHAKASTEAYAGQAEGRVSQHFSLLDVTAGLPDDSREDDQRVRAQVERERQGRVRAARAVIQAHPGLETVLARDQTKLTLFCAVHHVTPGELCPHAEDNAGAIRAPGTPRDGMPALSVGAGQGLPREPGPGLPVWSGDRALSVCAYCHGWHAWARPVDVADVEEVLAAPADWLSEVRAREVACLPETEA